MTPTIIRKGSKKDSEKKKFSFLFEYTPDGEMYLTKITRPVSYFIMLFIFIFLLILNSFNVIHTDELYIETLKQVLLLMTGFYFTARTLEKIQKGSKKDPLDEK